MYVSTLLKEKGSSVVTADSGDPVRRVVQLLVDNHIGAVVLLGKEGKIAGILSERDLVGGLVRHGAGMLDMPARDLMTAEVVTCAPTDSIQDMMGLMTVRRFRHVPVVEDGKLVGIVSIGDVVKNRLDECSFEVDSLRHYVTGSR